MTYQTVQDQYENLFNRHFYRIIHGDTFSKGYVTEASIGTKPDKEIGLVARIRKIFYGSNGTEKNIDNKTN
ncbi:MAG: hypothetical protein ABIF10_05180 [Candidatus Woesearchaeota archaeon]